MSQSAQMQTLVATIDRTLQILIEQRKYLGQAAQPSLAVLDQLRKLANDLTLDVELVRREVLGLEGQIQEEGQRDAGRTWEHQPLQVVPLAGLKDGQVLVAPTLAPAYHPYMASVTQALYDRLGAVIRASFIAAHLNDQLLEAEATPTQFPIEKPPCAG